MAEAFPSSEVIGVGELATSPPSWLRRGRTHAHADLCASLPQIWCRQSSSKWGASLVSQKRLTSELTLLPAAALVTYRSAHHPPSTSCLDVRSLTFYHPCRIAISRNLTIEIYDLLEGLP